MAREIIYVFVLFFLYKVKAQVCSCGPQLLGNAPQCVAQELITSQVIRPQVATTVVDNSVSNSLANVLQLLVVSDVIASTLNSRAPCLLPPVSSICEQVPPLMYSPSVDIIAPRTEFIPPCAPVLDVIRPRCPCVESLPNFYGVSEVIPPVFNASPLTALGSRCGCGLKEFIPGPTFSPAFTTCVQELPSPVLSLGPNFCGGLTELIGPLGNFAPVTEYIFPPSLPGPLTCNCGCSPPPITYANIEPIPYTGVNYFY